MRARLASAWIEYIQTSGQKARRREAATATCMPQHHTAQRDPSLDLSFSASSATTPRAQRGGRLGPAGRRRQGAAGRMQQPDRQQHEQAGGRRQEWQWSQAVSGASTETETEGKGAEEGATTAPAQAPAERAVSQYTIVA